jgi:hypothetical protein
MGQVPIAKLHVLFAALSLILCARLVTNFDQFAFSQEFDSSNTNLTGIDAPAKLLRYTDPRGLFTIEYPADWMEPFQNNTVVFSSMNSWTTLGNKVYMITFDGEVSRFTTQLPVVERMLESFRIDPKYTIN